MSTKSVTIRIPDDLHVYLVNRAEEENRTLSNMIITILMNAGAQRDREILFKRITSLPDCNTCEKKHDCEYCPELGEPTRLNCPLWKK